MKIEARFLNLGVSYFRGGTVIPVDDDENFCGAFSYSEDLNLEIIHLRDFINTKRLI